MGGWFWCFFVSKYIEFMDTVLPRTDRRCLVRCEVVLTVPHVSPQAWGVMRKRLDTHSPRGILHVYHHAITPSIAWVRCLYCPR